MPQCKESVARPELAGSDDRHSAPISSKRMRLQIFLALAAVHDGAVQMIDTSVVRVRQHGACIAGATCS